MSKLIEICGAPGSGKTTTYNALLATWKKEDNWAPTEYPVKKIDFSSFRRFYSTAAQRFRKEKDFKALDAAGERFVSEFPEYMDHFWNSRFYKADESYQGVDLRFRNVNVFWSTLRKIQFQRESKNEKVLIACEGLLQRIGNGWYKKGSLEEDKREALNLINSMPLPDAVVYLEVDVESNVRRIQTRKKMLPAHRSFTASELQAVTRNNQERWNFICTVLEEKEVPLLKLDSGGELKKNAEKISQFAESVFAGDAVKSKPKQEMDAASRR